MEQNGIPEKSVRKAPIALFKCYFFLVWTEIKVELSSTKLTYVSK
jgi:hypothetical protein